VKHSSEERFLSKVSRPFGDVGCWVWTAGKFEKGYGAFKDRRKQWRAHRWSYEHWRGPVPHGLQLDHLCRVRACVNPWHLEAVDCRTNIVRGERGQAIRTGVCSGGHSLAEHASREYTRKDGRTYRQCVKCREVRRERKRQAALA